MKQMKTSELQSELEAIIAWFESTEADIDDAPAKYQRGLELVSILKERLSTTENTITKLQKSFDKVN